jgi:hypothetical protein
MWCRATFSINKYDNIYKNHITAGVRLTEAFKLKSKIVYDVNVIQMKEFTDAKKNR